MTINEFKQNLRTIYRERKILKMFEKINSIERDDKIEKLIAEKRKMLDKYITIFDSLSAVDKAISYAVFYEGKTYLEVSLDMGYSESAVKRHISDIVRYMYSVMFPNFC